MLTYASDEDGGDAAMTLTLVGGECVLGPP